MVMNIKAWLEAQLSDFKWPEDITVLVCGGRDFADVVMAQIVGSYTAEGLALVEKKKAERQFIWDVLGNLHQLADTKMPRLPGGCDVPITIINGAARGADRASSHWVHQFEYWGVEGPFLKEYPADWDRHGKSAGSIRNQLMLFESKPHLVIAFPGGRGTADMVRKARHAKVRVLEIPYPIPS
jgi:hypothetical protein